MYHGSSHNNFISKAPFALIPALTLRKKKVLFNADYLSGEVHVMVFIREKNVP